MFTSVRHSNRMVFYYRLKIRVFNIKLWSKFFSKVCERYRCATVVFFLLCIRSWAVCILVVDDVVWSFSDRKRRWYYNVVNMFFFKRHSFCWSTASNTVCVTPRIAHTNIAAVQTTHRATGLGARQNINDIYRRDWHIDVITSIIYVTFRFTHRTHRYNGCNQTNTF